MSKKRKKRPAQKNYSTKKPVQRAAPPVPPAIPPAEKALPPERKNRPGNRYRNVILTIAMLAAVALSVWMAVSPSLEKQRINARQDELLASIEQGDGVIVLDEVFAAEVDFYDNGGEEEQEINLPSPAELDGTAPVEAEAPVNTTITGIGVLSIDRIDLKLPVTDGVSTSQLKVAVGHVPQTAPIGGEGNAVIAGHRSYTYGQYFNRLGEMAVGDVIQYQSIDGEIMEFTVYEILEVLPGDQAAFEQPEGRQTITLLTCTPIRTATHRLLVRAERIS